MRVSVWLYQPTSEEELRSHQYVINRMLNSDILAEDVVHALRETTHVLAATREALRLERLDSADRIEL